MEPSGCVAAVVETTIRSSCGLMVRVRSWNLRPHDWTVWSLKRVCRSPWLVPLMPLMPI